MIVRNLWVHVYNKRQRQSLNTLFCIPTFSILFYFPQLKLLELKSYSLKKKIHCLLLDRPGFSFKIMTTRHGSIWCLHGNIVFFVSSENGTIVTCSNIKFNFILILIYYKLMAILKNQLLLPPSNLCKANELDQLMQRIIW